MASINDNSNRVIAEFGGRIPAHLLQFNDARREFLSVRSLMLQQLGSSDTHKTVTSLELSGFAREGSLPDDIALGTPAFAEIECFNYSGTSAPEKVEIVPLDKIGEYEGTRVIAFYDSPVRYRAGFNFWDVGTVKLWYDPIADVLNTTGDMDANFAPAFITFVIKQSALNLVGVIMLNLAMNSAPEEDERMKVIFAALGSLQSNLIVQVEHWRKEFKKYVGSGFNTQARLRRTNEEILARGYTNVSGRRAMDGNW